MFTTICDRKKGEEVNRLWQEVNSLLPPRALVVPRNPLWTAEEEVPGDHQSRIANDQARGSRAYRCTPHMLLKGASANRKQRGKLTLRPAAPGAPASPFWPLPPCSPGSPASPWGSPGHELGFSCSHTGSGWMLTVWGAVLTFSPLSPLYWARTSAFWRDG